MNTLDFNSFRGNGIPRHYLIDDILGKVGLQRRLIRPAVSFILNENVEASVLCLSFDDCNMEGFM